MGHVAGFLRTRGQGVQHVAHRVGNLAKTVSRANALRRTTGEGLEFLDVPRAYYGDLPSINALAAAAGVEEATAAAALALLEEKGLVEAAGASLDATAADFADALGSLEGADELGAVVGRSRYENLRDMLGDRFSDDEYLRRADVTGRGGAAAGTWIFHGRRVAATPRPWIVRGRRVAATPRPGREYSAETGCGDATWIFRGDESRPRRRVAATRRTFGPETRASWVDLRTRPARFFRYVALVRERILVDVQGDDVLLQIFSRPVLSQEEGGDAPFLEFIQRVCSTRDLPRPGCGGFGIRNFLALFLAIELDAADRALSAADGDARKEAAALAARDCLRRQLAESNPILGRIADAAAAEAEFRAAGRDDDAAAAGAARDAGQKALQAVSAAFADEMRAIRSRG